MDSVVLENSAFCEVMGWGTESAATSSNSPSPSTAEALDMNQVHTLEVESSSSEFLSGNLPAAASHDHGSKKRRRDIDEVMDSAHEPMGEKFPRIDDLSSSPSPSRSSGRSSISPLRDTSSD